MKKFLFFRLLVLLLIIAFSCKQATGLKETSPISVRVSEDRLIRIDKMLKQSIDQRMDSWCSWFYARDGKLFMINHLGSAMLKQSR